MDSLLESERSLGSVVHDVGSNLGRIVQAEVLLAKIEVADHMDQAAHVAAGAAKELVGGVVFGHLAIGFALLGVMRGLETVVAPWVAAVIVAVGCAVTAVVLTKAGVTQITKVRLLWPTAVHPSTGSSK
jgi:Putative Actinobacterial Holin-X, holin superfamily III